MKETRYQIHTLLGKFSGKISGSGGVELSWFKAHAISYWLFDLESINYPFWVYSSFIIFFISFIYFKIFIGI